MHNNRENPRAVKNAIPYGLAIGTKRICSSSKDYRRETRSSPGLSKEDIEGET